ncbi:MAG: DNA-directed RNA polymerase subunit omega [Acholeplasmataceae bacterium]|jgi:DNA-directed RNA polymerase subunit omega|nr:DNA-directed RNA polymerase subunit omega [Acholeplasmataceae bacterium]
MTKNKDGMRYPSIDKLLNKIDSKYKLVYAASKIAGILESEKLSVEGKQCVKSIGIALEEILDGRVEIDFES